jgi:hypothetical protein
MVCYWALLHRVTLVLCVVRGLTVQDRNPAPYAVQWR